MTACGRGKWVGGRGGKKEHEIVVDLNHVTRLTYVRRKLPFREDLPLYALRAQGIGVFKDRGGKERRKNRSLLRSAFFLGS